MKAIPQERRAVSRWKPSRAQTLLLRAALWKGDAARESWKEWSRRLQLTPLDPGERRLLPLVYLNLCEKDSDSTEFEYPGQVYREFKESNGVILHNAAVDIGILQDAGIPTLVLKTMALIPLYYHDPGARPTRDIDILVPTATARAALEVLSEAGWILQGRPLEAFDDAYLESHYAHTLQNADKVHLDLHRHVLSIETHADGDADFWANAIPVQLESVETQALAPTDQLVHTCVHGSKWHGRVAPIRWVDDAYFILTRSQVDWERLLEQSQRRQLVMTVRNLLAYVYDELAAPIPDSVMQALRRMPVTRFDRVQYELYALPPAEHNTVRKLWFHYYQYRMLSPSYKDTRKFERFPRYLRDTWELRDTRQVPGYVANYFLHSFKRGLNRVTHPAVGADKV